MHFEARIVNPTDKGPESLFGISGIEIPDFSIRSQLHAGESLSLLFTKARLAAAPPAQSDRHAVARYLRILAERVESGGVAEAPVVVQVVDRVRGITICV